MVHVEGSGLHQDLRSLGALVQQQGQGLQAVSHLKQIMESTQSTWEHRFEAMVQWCQQLEGALGRLQQERGPLQEHLHQLRFHLSKMTPRVEEIEGHVFEHQDGLTNLFGRLRGLQEWMEGLVEPLRSVSFLEVQVAKIPQFEAELEEFGGTVGKNGDGNSAVHQGLA